MAHAHQPPASWTEAIAVRRDEVTETSLRVWLGLLSVVVVFAGALQQARVDGALLLGSTPTIAIVLTLASTMALLAALPPLLPPRWTRSGATGCAGLFAASLCIALLDTGSDSGSMHLLMTVLGVGFAMLIPTRTAIGLSVLVASAALWPVINLLAAPGAISSLRFANRFVDVVGGTCLASIALIAHRWVARGRTSALRQLALLAEHDGLTNVLNRRTILQRLMSECHRADRYGGRVTVLLLDVDKFKSFNSELGYAAGDRMLVAVGAALRALVRDDAWARFGAAVGRYGGEEFVIVLPDASPEDAEQFAKACRETVAALRVAFEGAELRVTVSVGTHTAEAALGANPARLLAAADAAMYEAKSSGGDTVRVAASSDASTTSVLSDRTAVESTVAPDPATLVPKDDEPRRLHALILRALLLLGGSWTLMFVLLDIALWWSAQPHVDLNTMVIGRGALAATAFVAAWFAQPIDRESARVTTMHVTVTLATSALILLAMTASGGLESPYFVALVWLALAWSIAFAAPPTPAMASVAIVAFALPLLVPYTPGDGASGFALWHRVLVLLAAGFVAVGTERRFTRLRHEESAARAMLDQMARIDPLTTLPNRIATMARADALALRADAAPVALVLLDLDHFKRLNDQHGHLAGDEALVAVAQEILETIRNADVAGRLGGEEFLVVAPYTDVAGAGLLAERLRTRIQQTTLSQTDQSLTASFGIAMLGEEDTVAHALARADRALRTAKQEGRNRVAIDPIALHAGER